MGIMIPLAEPVLRGNEWRYIKECLDTGWVSSVGSFVNRFEEDVAKYLGVAHAVAVVNGTAALHLALIVAGVKENDEVLVPTLTFIAPVNVVRYLGAHPVFIDCDTKTLCLDIGKVESFLTEECTRRDDGYTYNRVTGRRVSAVIPVHIFGHPTDMDALTTLCKRYRISIIEDASESLGSEYRGKKTGVLGDIGCLSFNGNKIITTGGGGMIVTNNEAWAKRARHLSTQAKRDPFIYDHDDVGYNYRLTNVPAALGVAQMEQLDEFVAAKRRNALRYKELLANMPTVAFLWEEPWATSNFWFYTIQVPPRHKDPLMQFLLSKGIQVSPVWALIHTSDMYRNCQTYRIENAQKIWETCVHIPCSVNITEEQIETVAGAIKNYFA